MAEKATETPLMKQYFSFKSKYPDAMLLFRVGDFYETYGEDAVKSSEILGIVLTKRSSAIADSIELAGFPHHALDTYLLNLVSGLAYAGCVDETEGDALDVNRVLNGVAGGAVNVGNDGTVFMEQTVKQCRFADIRLADDGDGDALFQRLTGFEALCEADDSGVDVVCNGEQF